MNQKWSWLVHLALFIVVVISLLLTFSVLSPPREVWNMIQNDSSAESELATTTTNTINPQVRHLNKQEVYSAHILNYHRADGYYYQSIDTDILNKVKQYLILSPAVDVSGEIAFDDIYAFREAINQEDFLEIEYGDLVPINFLFESMSNLSAEYQTLTFDSLIYVKDANYIAFLNEAEDLVYKVPMTNIDSDSLWSLISTEEEAFVPVIPYEFTGGRHYLSTAPITVDKYTYMVERQSNTAYLNQLFDTPREIQDFSDANFSRYYSDSQNIMINNDTAELEYNREIAAADNDNMTTIDIMDASFKALQDNQLIADDDMYYTDVADNTVTYRKYVDGLPVFGQNQVAQVQVSVMADDVSQLHMSTLAATTPLTDRTEQYQLMSGEDAVRLLQSSQTPMGDVESIKLGYTWVDSEESSRLVEFIPAWYVKVADHWYLLERLVNVRSYPELATVNQTTDERVYIEDIVNARNQTTANTTSEESIENTTGSENAASSSTESTSTETGL